MREFWRWTIYGFRVCIFVTIFLTVLFFAIWYGTIMLSEKAAPPLGLHENEFADLIPKHGKPFWAVPLGLVIYIFGAALSFGLIRQIIVEIKRYPKDSETNILKEETPKEDNPKEETILLPHKSKRSKLEIVGLIIILLSIVGNLFRGIQRGDLDNPIHLLVNIFFPTFLVNRSYHFGDWIG